MLRGNLRGVSCTLAGVICLAAIFAGAAHAESQGSRVVREDLEAFFEKRVSVGSFSVEVPPLTGFSAAAEKSPSKLRTEMSTRSREPFQGRVPVSVALYSGDRLLKRSVVTPYLRVMEKVVVPVRDVKRGETLAAADLIEVERDRARFPKDVVQDLEYAVGMRSKASLRKDRVFRSSQVEGIPIVERGDRVQLVLRAGALVIQSSGKAQESGRLGEWIRVMNLDSKRELSGRIDQEGRVHVAF